jgi:hypothetical protein
MTMRDPSFRGELDNNEPVLDQDGLSREEEERLKRERAAQERRDREARERQEAERK